MKINAVGNDVRDGLIVFTRLPVPGKTKIRLIPALGTEGAANLHCQLTEHAVARVGRFCRENSVIIVSYHLGISPKRLAR